MSIFQKQWLVLENKMDMNCIDTKIYSELLLKNMMVVLDL